MAVRRRRCWRKTCSLDRAALHPSPAARLQTIAELRESFHGVRELLGLGPDGAAWASHVERIVAAIDAERRLDVSASTRDTADSRKVWQGGRYVVEHPIDAGAAGTVFRGHDRQLDVPVAMKVVRLGADSTARRRFLREVRLLRAVRHTHLVQGFDLFEEGGTLVAVMELLVGGRLDSRWVAGDISVSALTACIADIADALNSLHAMGVIHRDVKPANIMVTNERGAVLVDFELRLKRRLLSSLLRWG